MSELIIKFINSVETEHYDKATRSTYTPNNGPKEVDIWEDSDAQDYIKKFFELNGNSFDQAILNLGAKS